MDSQCSLSANFSLGWESASISQQVAVTFRKYCRNAVARMTVATIACQSVGMLLAAIITLALLKNAQSGQIWRLFLTMEGVIALVFFSLRLSEPDSPHWLIVRGRFVEAAEAFIRIMPEQREAVLQITDNAGNPGVANSVAPPKAPGIAILFSRRYRARTALVAVPWFLMDIATYGVRSEEHTSELQSQSNLVCRLLLEKKKH